MVIYEVNIQIASHRQSEFLAWLKPHMEEMLTQLGFLQAQLWKENSLPGDLPEKLVVHYQVDTLENLQNYFSHQATKMRQGGIEIFGSDLTISRRVLTPGP